MDLNANSNSIHQDDDLFDDLMNIVQTDNSNPNENKVNYLKNKIIHSFCEINFFKFQTHLKGALNNENSNDKKSYEHLDEYNDDNKPDDYEFDSNEDEEICDEDEELIDQMLEKPIDILDEKDQVNYYTYNKIQIKSKIINVFSSN